MPLALDDGELEEEEEEELEFVRFPVLLFKSPPQWLHDVSTSLPPTHEDKEDEEGEETCIWGELTALSKTGELKILFHYTHLFIFRFSHKFSYRQFHYWYLISLDALTC